MTTRAKVLLPLSGVILFAAVGAALAILQLVRIQDELEAVVEYDWPLVRALTEITEQVHEQAIQFERAAHDGERRTRDPEAAAAYAAARRAFADLDASSARRIADARGLASSDAIDDRHVRAELGAVVVALDDIEERRARYVSQASQVFALLDRGEVAAASRAEQTVQAREDDLRRAVAAVLGELESFTREASERARQDEQNAVYSVGLFTSVSILLTILAGGYILRLLRQPTVDGHILPICPSCKKIRDHDGVWSSVDAYAVDRSDPTFMDSLCPNCHGRLE